MAKARTKRERKHNAQQQTASRKLAPQVKKDGGHMTAAAVSDSKQPYQELATITPTQAAKWLETHNEKNRGLRQPKVDAIARDIVAGRWEVDGSAIRFSRGGRLLDGQHRLHAIVKAGRPVQTFVAYGLRDTAMDTIDRGIPRTIGDLLKLHLGDQVPEKNAVRLAAMCTTLSSIEAGGHDARVRLTFAEADEIWRRYEHDIRWAMKVIGSKIEPGGPSGGAPVLGAFAYARKISPDKLEAFAHQFKEGGVVGVKGISSSARALRTAVTASLGKDSKLKRELTSRTLRCIEAFLKGEELQKAYVDVEVVDRMQRLRERVK